MQKTIEIHLPHYEIPQRLPHYLLGHPSLSHNLLHLLGAGQGFTIGSQRAPIGAGGGWPARARVGHNFVKNV